MSRKRIEFLDLIRTFAVFGVVLCHVTENVFSFKVENISSYPIALRIFVFALFGAGRLGVPFFLMISGYLLLDRDYQENDIKRFWKDRFCRLLLCTIIWFVIYALFIRYILRVKYDLLYTSYQILFATPFEMGHTWYLPMILGFYITIPFAAKVLHSLRSEVFIFPMVIYGVLCFIFPLIDVISRSLSVFQVSSQISNGFGGGEYGWYLLIGFFIREGILKKFKTVILIVISVISFGCIIGLQMFAYHCKFEFGIWYDCVFIMTCSVSLFEIFTRKEHIPMKRVFSFTAKYSLGVYLIHEIVREIVMRYYNIEVFPPALRVIVLWIVATVISYALAWLLHKIPKVGNILLYLKPDKQNKK